MFSKNIKFCDWRQRLEKRGVSLRVLWSTKSHPSQRYDDVALVSFVGNKFQPTEATAVIQNYDNEGFGVWFQSHTGDIEEETAHIAKPRERK